MCVPYTYTTPSIHTPCMSRRAHDIHLHTHTPHMHDTYLDIDTPHMHDIHLHHACSPGLHAPPPRSSPGAVTRLGSTPPPAPLRYACARLHTRHLHWACTLCLYTTPVHCACTVRLYSAPVHYACTLRLYTTPVHCACTLRLYSAPVHYAWTLRLFTMPVHCACSLRLYTAPVHYACTTPGSTAVDRGGPPRRVWRVRRRSWSRITRPGHASPHALSRRSTRPVGVQRMARSGLTCLQVPAPTALMRYSAKASARAAGARTAGAPPLGTPVRSDGCQDFAGHTSPLTVRGANSAVPPRYAVLDATRLKWSTRARDRGREGWWQERSKRDRDRERQAAGAVVVVGSADKCCRAWRLGSGESGGWRGRAGGEMAGGEAGGDGQERKEDAGGVVAGAYARLTGLGWAAETPVRRR